MSFIIGAGAAAARCKLRKKRTLEKLEFISVLRVSRRASSPARVLNFHLLAARR
jgi:hypothetical protein